MPEILSPPEDFFSDDQCWVWPSGSNLLGKLSRLMRPNCLDPRQQIEKQGITPVISAVNAFHIIGGITCKNTIFAHLEH